MRLLRPFARRGLLGAALVLASSTGDAFAGERRAGDAWRPGLVAFTPHGIHASQPAARVAAYRRLRRAGVRAIRLDIVWSEVEQPDGRFDFSRFDEEVLAIRAAGLRVIGLLGYGHPRYSDAGGVTAGTPLGGGLPPFGIGSARYFPPRDPRSFARFASEAARHYGAEILAWEIWNEQNLGWRFWSPREDPAAYARLLCATRAALRRADPSTPVVFGGVFYPAVADLPHMSGPTFLERAYRSHPDLGRCFDVLAYHPYAYPFTSPELDVPVRGSVLAAADRMGAVLRRHGDGRKPLWITEVGWPTHDRAYGVDEAKQAQYVARMQAASFAGGVRLLNWYTYGDEPDPTGANQEAHFGFFRADGSAKPAYRALRTSWRALRGTRFVRDRSRSWGFAAGPDGGAGSGHALRFRRPDRRVTVVWVASEGLAGDQGPLPAAEVRAAIRLPVHARRITVVDHLGGRQAVRDGRRHLELVAGAGPQYVIEHAPRRAAR